MGSFLLQQHSAKLDPLVVAAGSVPRYLLWAEDLASGTVTSWQARFNAGSATLTGGLVRNDTGYNGRKALFLDGGDYVNLDTILGSFQAGQQRTVILAVRLVAEASIRCLINDAQSSGSTSTMFKVSLDSSDFANVTKSGNVSSSTPQIPENVPILFTFRSTGGTVQVYMRKRGEDTLLLTASLTATTNVHDQHTLFAQRFQATVSQYTSGYLRLALEFPTSLLDTNLTQVWDMLESADGYDCPTIEEPEILIQNVLGVVPHILFYGPDLTVGGPVAAIPNRGLGPDGTGLAQPANLPEAVTSYNNIPTLQLRGDGIVDWGSSLDGGWGTYNTSEVVLMAFQYGTAFANNLTFLAYSSDSISPTTLPSRWLETTSGGDVRSYQSVGNNTAEQVTTTTTPLKANARFCVAFSLDGSGNARLLVRSRTLLGAFSQTYVTGAMPSAIASAIDRIYMGGRFGSAVYTANNIGDVAYLSVSRNVSVSDEAGMVALVDLIESRNGLNLPMGRQANQMNSVPQPSSLKTWINARLQVSPVNLDDLSPNNADCVSTGVTFVSEKFDFGPADTNFAVPNPGVVIPAGTSSLACVAIVAKRPGTSLVATNYTIAGGNNLGSACFLVVAGTLSVLWNSTNLSSGYSVAGWVDNQPHIVAFDYDGSNVRFFVDDMTAPVATVAHGVARTTVRSLLIGRLGTAVGWTHYIHSLQYWVGSALTGAGEVQAAAVSQMMQLIHIYAEGDSNTAITEPSPAGGGAWWYQLRDIQFTNAGYLSDFAHNNAVSGSAWNNASVLAPTTILARGAALDTLAPTGVLNVLVIGSHSTNDINSYGLTLGALQGHIRTYCDARRASGKWHKIIIAEVIPQSRNAVNDAIIDSLNSWLPALIGEGRVDAVIPRPPELDDSTNTTYFLPNTSSAVGEHYNTTGLGILSDSILATVRQMKWSV